MLKIFAAENLQSAYLLRGMLNEAGIECQVFNEYAQGGMGEIPFTHTYPEIWLERDTDAARAKEIIASFEQGADEIDNHPCPACGEACPQTFDICWHCGAELKTLTDK